MGKELEPLVSVLTPVYNGEKFIAECIESVLAQSYENWEYIILDNCSSDGTLEILKDYSSRDKRIVVHENEKHLGHLDNGNKVFTLMSEQSKYCKVVHADDWLFSECIENMVGIGEQYPSVGIVSSYRLSGSEVNLDGLPYPSHFLSGKEVVRRYLFGKGNVFGSPTSILIRSSLIRKRDQIYDQSFVHSDTAACLDILKESDFGFVHQVLTYTRRHDESVTSRIAKKYETYQLEKLHNTVTYGKYYLSENEYQERLKKREEDYYEGMARKVLVYRSKEFFTKDYDAWRDLGLKFKPMKLLKHIILKIYLGVTMRIYKLFR
jgi:glycosyltransferase involved in cell wall biosynthesis